MEPDNTCKTCAKSEETDKPKIFVCTGCIFRPLVTADDSCDKYIPIENKGDKSGRQNQI